MFQNYSHAQREKPRSGGSSSAGQEPGSTTAVFKLAPALAARSLAGGSLNSPHAEAGSALPEARRMDDDDAAWLEARAAPGKFTNVD